MMFKTFDNKIDKWTAKIGVFGKSFNELGTAVNNTFKSVIGNANNFDENVGFGESLKNNLFAKKDWKKNSLGEIISQENIDSYIKELDLSSAKKKLKEIFDWKDDVVNGETSWENFFDTCKGGNEYLIEVVKNTNDLSKLTGEDLVKANQQARASALAHNEAIKSQTFSAKAGKVAFQALATAGNMLTMWGVSWALEWAVKGMDRLVHSAEYAEKAIKAATDNAKSFNDAIKGIQKETTSMEKSVGSIIDRYAELSQGVNPFTNENKSLSTDDYEEFLGLNEQLAELFPSLTRNYDENGNALLGLSGSVASVTESIKELVEQEKELARAKVRENVEQYFNGTDDADGAWKALEGRTQRLEEVNEAIAKLKDTRDGLLGTDTVTMQDREYLKYVNYIRDHYGDDVAGTISQATSSKWYNSPNNYFQRVKFSIDFSKLELTETQKERIARSYDTLYNELLAKQETAKAELDSQNNEFSNNALLWLEDLPFYKDDEYVQAAIQSIVRNLDWTKVDLDAFGLERLDLDGVKMVIQDTILTPFQVACNDPETKQALNEALEGLFTLDASGMSLSDAKNAVDSYVQTISGVIGVNPIKLKGIFGFDDIDGSYERLQNSIRRLTHDHGQTDREAHSYLMDEVNFQDLTQAQVEVWLEAAAGAENAAQAVETYKAKLAELAGQGSNPASDIFSLRDAENALTPLGELNEQLNNVQAAYKNLKDAMDAYSSTGSITMDQFQAIVEQGAEFLDYLTLEDGQLGMNEQAMYKLAKARLTEMKAQMVQGIIDNVSSIHEEADANRYLASTNYELEKSYHKLAESQLAAWAESALANGWSQDKVDEVTNKARADIEKINALADSVNIKSLGNLGKESISFTELLDKELDALDKRMDAGHADFNDYIGARLDLIEGYYRQGKLKADEYYSYLEKHYDRQLSYMDKVVGAVTRRIDKEIDALEGQKEDIEGFCQAQIDSLEKQKSSLEEANRERERQLDLQKALYDMERAEGQRTKLVYTEGKGMVYRSDPNAIKDAKKNVDDARYTMQVSDIEKEIAKLEEARDKRTSAIDDKISKLNEYKDAWNDVSSAYEETQEDLIAAMVLGQEWETDILNGRLDVLDDFKNQYINIQQAMADAAWESANEQAKAAALNQEHDDRKQKDPPQNTINIGGGGPGAAFMLYHTGLKRGLVDKHSFDEDFRLVQRVGLGEREVPAILKEGEAVATQQQISNIADGLRSNSQEDGVIVTPDGHLLRPLQEGDRGWELVKAFEPLMAKVRQGEGVFPSASFDHQKQMEQWTREITNNNVIHSVAAHNRPTITMGDIHVTCPGVTEQQVAERLGGVIGRELNKQFSGFHNLTDQWSRT